MDARPAPDKAARVLEALADIGAASTLDDWARRACRHLLDMVPGVSSTYTEVNTATGRAAAVVHPDPGLAWFARWRPFFGEHAHENPIVAHIEATGDGSVATWLDRDPERRFERAALYRGFYVPNGIRSQIGFALATEPGEFVGFAVNRDGGDFAVGERTTLTLLRPHLLNLYRLVAAREAGVSGLSDARAGALGLTARQTDVVRLVVAGRTNDQIASELGISAGTVRKHLEAVFGMLGVASRAALVARALGTDAARLR